MGGKELMSGHKINKTLSGEKYKIAADWKEMKKSCFLGRYKKAAVS